MNFNVTRLIAPMHSVSSQDQRNFWLLFSDMVWFGVLSGSTISFLTIYTAHIGASVDQIGLINAAPPFVSLLFSLAFGAWILRNSARRVVLISAGLMRLYYLPLIVIPILLPAQMQIWVIIAMTFLMSIPGTGLQVSFTVLFGEAVPDAWRAFVAGARNAIFAMACILTSLICGAILQNAAFPSGYQIVFGIGFFGAVMSVLSLYFIHPAEGLPETTDPQVFTMGLPSSSEFTPGRAGVSARLAVARIQTRLRIDILKSPYSKVLLQIFAFHLTQYLPIPLFPIMSVQVLHVSDQIISIANALFYFLMFLASTQLPRIVRRLGNQRTTGLGLVSLAVFPILLALAQDQWLYLIANMFGGTGWALASGSMYNYGLEKATPNPPAPYLAWFTLFANAGMLLGSLAGPLMAGWIHIRWALALFAAVRLITGIIIARAR